MKERIYVFARPPVAGRVKTRLAATVGPERAAALYGAFLSDVLRAARGVGVPVVVSAAEAPDHPALVALAPDLPRLPQSPGDLGERMLRVFEHADLEGVDRALIVGSDHPTLRAADLRACLDAVGEGRLVLGPAEDGGFWCIGAPRGCPLAPALAGVPWSTARVLEETTRRARAAGLEVHHGPGAFDVDEEPDLERLFRGLATLEPGGAPATRAAVASLGKRW